MASRKLKAISQPRRNDYRKSVQSAVYGLWSGNIDAYGFMETMTSAIGRSFRNAWIDGAAECGIGEDDLTEDEIATIESLVNEEIGYALSYMNDIIAGNKVSGGKFRTLSKRVRMWANKYDALYNQGQASACGDQKMKWIFGDTQHCSSCLRLNGRVYRGSVWTKYGVLPQSRDLECKGYHCRCHLEITTDPVTPGFPPAIP